MMQHRIAQHEIEAFVRKRQAVSIRHLEFDAAREFAARGREIRLRLRDHPRRPIHADEFPSRQAPRQLDHDLPGPRADVERPAALGTLQQAQPRVRRKYCRARRDESCAVAEE